ncbi:cytochrome c oxidase assembly protein [Pseudarthrobacter oxydans]|uniref:cytochrome c oxidase assembly protein n=1 Tax=Pseudarthrobacter oxydans TaxID=1671 RepID=UPI0038233D1A
MDDHSHVSGDLTGQGLPGLVLLLPLAWAAAAYLIAAAATRRRGIWPVRRTLFWLAGLAAAAAALAGPVADAAHTDFTAHMAAHLLIGMAAPLLLVSAAPVSLALRYLRPRPARALTRVLRSVPVRVLTHPVTAAVLNVGGLWALYATGLYQASHQIEGLRLLIHAHMLAAGYLLTAALIGTDPDPHRAGYRTRAVILVATLAGHDILAKYLYANPPAGIPEAQAQSGAQLMYYGGDTIHLIIITIFCYGWYRRTRPRAGAQTITAGPGPA